MKRGTKETTSKKPKVVGTIISTFSGKPVPLYDECLWSIGAGTDPGRPFGPIRHLDVSVSSPPKRSAKQS